MQQTKHIYLQKIRKLGIIIGFAFFIMFIFKASNEVGNPKIAAGVQKANAPVSTSQGISSINSKFTSYSTPVSSVTVQVTESDEKNKTDRESSDSSVIAARKDQQKAHKETKVQSLKHTD